MKEKEVIRIFISYAQKGPDWGIDRVVGIIDHLNRNRKKEYHIHHFYDNYLEAGREFTERIKYELENADIVILLITMPFFESEYINTHEKPIIKRLHKEKKSVIPIIIGDTAFEREWVYGLGVKTLPGNPDTVLFNARNRDSLWKKVLIGLEDAVDSTYERKRSFITQLEGNKGCVLSLLILIGIIGFMYFWNKSSSNEDVTEKQDYYEEFYPPEEISSGNYGEIELRRIDERDSQEQATPESYSDIERTDERKYVPPKDPLTSVEKQTIPRSSARKDGYYGKEGYGRYESCQGLNRNGYKPCKRNRRWFIVNESEGIHHMIGFNIETHKDIYAIRPFYDDIAEVYFYDGRKMFLSFCVDLQDRTIDCTLLN